MDGPGSLTPWPMPQTWPIPALDVLSDLAVLGLLLPSPEVQIEVRSRASSKQGGRVQPSSVQRSAARALDTRKATLIPLGRLRTSVSIQPFTRNQSPRLLNWIPGPRPTVLSFELARLLPLTSWSVNCCNQ